MNRILRLFASVTFLMALPAWAADDDVLPAAGDEISQYRNVGNWSVHENRTRKSCFVSQADDKGNLVQLGLTKDNEYGYIGIFKKDADLPEGDEAVAIVVNDKLYVGRATNVVQGASGNYKGGYILANNKQLRLDLEKSKEMVVFPDLPFIVTVNLDDMRNAIFEARECTDKLQGS